MIKPSSSQVDNLRRIISASPRLVNDFFKGDNSYSKQSAL